MNGYVVFLFLMMNFLGFSQCEDSDKFDLGGSYHSKTSNYFILQSNHRSNNFCNSKQVKKTAEFILDKAKSYIINRAGDKFYKKLKFYQIEVNYSASIDSTHSRQTICELSDFEHTFWVIYAYKNKKVKYAFGLEFDKDGNMISENQFPKFIEGQNFEKFTAICDALAVVKSDERFAGKKVENIELAYLDEVNSFCWLVIEQDPRPKELGKLEYYALDLYYINATTNELVTIKQETKARISCGYKLDYKKD